MGWFQASFLADLWFVLHGVLQEETRGLDQAMFEHSDGLIVEHELALKWDVSVEDEKIIKEHLLNMLNPPGADMEWKWTNWEENWMFPFVKLLTEDPKESLAMHMLCRHGLAPLVASRNASFASHRSSYAGEGLEVFYQAENEFAPVIALRELLGSLTLGGLRNLHSFDHAWSLEHGSNSRACQENHGECPLQAAQSGNASRFLHNNGFTSATCAKAKSTMKDIVKQGCAEIDDLTHSIYFHYENTGAKTTFDANLVDFDGNHFVDVAIEWEDGGSVGFSLEIDPDTALSLKTGKDKKKRLLNLVEKELERRASHHAKYFRENRHEYYVGELAEFARFTIDA